LATIDRVCARLQGAASAASGNGEQGTLFAGGDPDRFTQL
jgi:hypothetical protein